MWEGLNAGGMLQLLEGADPLTLICRHQESAYCPELLDAS